MEIGIQRETWVCLSSRFKRLALLLTLPTIEDRILEKKGSIPFASKAINHRSECLAFVPCLIRHFSLVCLLAVLIFSSKVSFATTVQGTTVYSSSAEAQTQINTLITVAMAAHPGATQNGNAVQWVEDGRSVTRAWTIRGGLSTISKFTLRYYGGGGDVYNAPRFDFTLIGYDGFAALRNQALGIVPSILRNSPSQLINNPHAEPEDVYIAYDAYTNGVRWTTRMVINYGATTAVITPYYIDYQDTGSQLCPIPDLTQLTDPVAIDFDNNVGSRWRPGGLTADYQKKLKCVEDAIFARGGTSAGTSAYRPEQYQRHLYEIVKKDVELSEKYMKAHPDCQARRDRITKKMKDHGLKYDQEVAVPGTSRHESGTAFDLTPSELTKAQLATIYKGCGVTNKAVSSEPWHTQ